MAQETGFFMDSRDSKTYKTIRIGTQTWIAENLAYKSNSGCWAYDNDASNVKKYGYLYNWETAKKVCPAGWHLPSDAEWKTLTTYLGGDDVAGDKLKSALSWTCPNNMSASNTSGFTALPGGYRDIVGVSDKIGGFGFWWSSDESKDFAKAIGLNCGSSVVVRSNGGKSSGFSVRCLRN